MNDTDFLHSRLILYDLLARLYTYPLDNATLDAISALHVENAPVALTDALAVMQAHIAAAEDRGALVDALNVEATRLFEGPGQPAVPPFASFHLNERQLMGSAAHAVRRTYLAWNALPRDSGRVPPDHLALELGFMAYLARGAMSANGNARRWLAGSAEFLREHLLTWVPHFTAQVGTASAHPFFVGLANLMRAVVDTDAAWLEEIVNDSKDTEVIR